MLLDEATSSLDVETEKSVMEALRRLCEGKTTLIIAHRLSTVVDCDEILVMLDGKMRRARQPCRAHVSRWMVR